MRSRSCMIVPFRESVWWRRLALGYGETGGVAVSTPKSPADKQEADFRPGEPGAQHLLGELPLGRKCRRCRLAQRQPAAGPAGAEYGRARRALYTDGAPVGHTGHPAERQKRVSGCGFGRRWRPRRAQRARCWGPQRQWGPGRCPAGVATTRRLPRRSRPSNRRPHNGSLHVFRGVQTPMARAKEGRRKQWECHCLHRLPPVVVSNSAALLS